jgi:hypothetical protein
MDASQLEEIAHEIEGFHKSMKNLIEIVFAISPLLALSTQGWTWKTADRNYLFRVGSSFVL